MEESRSKCTRRELIRQGGLIASTALIVPQLTIAAPNSQGAISPQPSSLPPDPLTRSQNARRVCLAAGGF